MPLQMSMYAPPGEPFMQKAIPFSLPLSGNGFNATVVSAAPGVVLTYNGANMSTEPRFLKFYDKATAPVPGADTPVWVALLQGQGEFANPSGLSIRFLQGIALAFTDGATMEDSTPISIGDISGFNISYAPTS